MLLMHAGRTVSAIHSGVHVMQASEMSHKSKRTVVYRDKLNVNCYLIANDPNIINFVNRKH